MPYYRFECLVPEIDDRVMQKWIQKVDEVMRCCVSFCLRDLVCDDVKRLVDLHGISTYDFPVEARGNFNS